MTKNTSKWEYSCKDWGTSYFGQFITNLIIDINKIINNSTTAQILKAKTLNIEIITWCNKICKYDMQI